jgi:hypothetical protein
MTLFFSTLPRHLLGCFRGRRLRWRLAAIGLAFLLVWGGVDRLYFVSTRSPVLRACLFPAVVIGGLLPIARPPILLSLGARTRLLGWAVGQSQVIGALLAAA